MALDQASLKQLCEELIRDRENHFSTLNKAHGAVATALVAINGPDGRIEPALVLNLSETQQPGAGLASQTRNETRERESYVPRRTLPAESFSEDDFRAHLKLYNWEEASLERMLGALFYNSDFIRRLELFMSDPDPQRAKKSYIRLESVGFDGVAQSVLPPGDASDVIRIWRGFSSTNSDSTARQQAVGRRFRW